MSAEPGKVWLVGAGPGEPDLITWRGAELLARAEVVLYDALSHPALLELCPQAELIDVGKRYGERATPQDRITAQLVELARSGRSVVRLKGGDPLLFARGAEEALALAEAGIPFEIVPGVTSPSAAATFAGISLTHRDLSSSVTFITGSDRKGKEWSPDAWTKLATATGTICILMGMRRIGEITRAIIDGGRAPDTPAAVVTWGARPEQRTVVARLDSIAERVRQESITNPAIIIVGEVVSLREKLSWYETKPLFGKRILVARPAHQARATAEAIRGRGAASVLVPALEILPSPEPERLRQALLSAGDYDWVVFTSTNGVEKSFDAIERLGKDARVFGGTRVAVIGPRTGDALRRRGITADLVAREFVAESLARDLLARSGRLERVLLPRAAVAREVLPDTLRAHGARVDVVPAYVTRSVEGEGRQRLLRALNEQTDVLLLTSSSMVDAVCDVLHDAEVAIGEVVVACIGPVTAETARRRGLNVDVEANVYTIDGALDALEEHFRTEARYSKDQHVS